MMMRRMMKRRRRRRRKIERKRYLSGARDRGRGL